MIAVKECFSVGFEDWNPRDGVEDYKLNVTSQRIDNVKRSANSIDSKVTYPLMHNDKRHTTKVHLL